VDQSDRLDCPQENIYASVRQGAKKWQKLRLCSLHVSLIGTELQFPRVLVYSCSFLEFSSNVLAALLNILVDD
jgi:hypothetical protein